MRRFFPVLFFVLLNLLSAGQNLVPNPSFENYSQCPTTSGQMNYAIPWVDVQPTSDYYNCSNVPSNCPDGRTGSGFAGVSVYRPSWNSPYREYIGTYLTSPLIAGVEYYCEFWVKLECGKCWMGDSFGALFTVGQPPQQPGWNMLNPNQPQIENSQFRMLNERDSWMKICGTFFANGGEDFITMGSFKDDNNSSFIELPGCNGNYGVHWSYYFIDDVLLEIRDTSVTYNCDDTTLFPNPHPAEEVSMDKPCGLTLPNVISPNGDGMNDWFIIPDTALTSWQLKVYDRWGKEEFSGSSKSFPGWDGKRNNEKIVTEGTYFYILTSIEDECYEKGFISVLLKEE